MKPFFFLFISSICLFTRIYGQGDLCATAVVLPGTGTYNANGPSTGGGCFNCVGSTNADWYSFTAPSNGVIDVATCFGGTDTRLFVYDGSCGVLNQIATADDDCDMGTGNLWASEALSIPVSSGTTYYIEFDDRWSTNGFSWNFTFSSTPCMTAASLPYFENFDGVSPGLPPCWSTNNPAEVTTTASCTGSNNESLQVNGVAGAYAYSKIIDASGQASVEVAYLYRGGDNTNCTNNPEAGDNINVDYWNGASWVNIANYDGATAPNVFTQESIIISSGLTNTFQLRFQSVFGSGSNFDNYNFDDLEVQSAVACPTPTSLNVSNISTNSAYLSWVENGSATLWEVEWDNAGFTPGTGSNSAQTTANPLVLSTLSPITSYDFYVRSICAPGDTSLWGGPYNFTTLNVGLDDLIFLNDVTIYPNPNKGLFTLKIDKKSTDKLSVKITNIHGQIVYMNNSFNHQTNIDMKLDLRKEAKGVYFLSISNNSGTLVKKIIVY